MPANRDKKNETSFTPGKSGNPQGRPKIDPNLTVNCRNLTAEVIDFWRDKMRDEDAKDADRLRASENIMDRAWGKAMQAVEVTGEVRPKIDVSKLTDAQLDVLTDLAIIGIGEKNQENDM